MDRQCVLFVVAHRSVERELLPTLQQTYEVVLARLRREALQIIDDEPPDLLLVDVPSIRFDISRFFECLDEVPVPITTFLLLGRGMRLDQIPRASGTLRHPFSPGQLMRRLARVMPQGAREIVEWESLCLDTENRFLIWHGQQEPLTPKQASLMLVLLAAPGTVVSREQLMMEVWGTDYMGDTRTLDVHIHWLRKALDQLHVPFEIETERGVGYRLIRA